MLTALTAVGDFYIVNQDTPLGISATSLVVNDASPNGKPLTAALVLDGGPNSGSLTVQPNGDLSYTPSPTFYGYDSFSYFAWDGERFSTVAATVTIEVKQVFGIGIVSRSVPFEQPKRLDVLPPFVPGAIRALNDSYTTAEDVALSIGGAGVLSNDYADPNVGPLSAVLVAGPAHGTLTLDASGRFSYLPARDYFGRDRFTYQAASGDLTSNVATVSLEITPVNDAPVANNDHFVAESGVPLPVGPAQLLANDRDVEGDWLSAVLPLSSAPQTGQLILTAGRLSYVPIPGSVGFDQFEYFVRDGELFSDAAAVVTLNVIHPRRHNSNWAEDVNNDLSVSPLDAVLVINHLNSSGGGPVLLHAARTFDFLDVSGDGMLSPLDAVWVINLLNAAKVVDLPATAAPEFNAPAASQQTVAVDEIYAALADEAARLARRRRGLS
jgi:Bacterial Ig domain/Dockerin type I domain